MKKSISVVVSLIVFFFVAAIPVCADDHYHPWVSDYDYRNGQSPSGEAVMADLLVGKPLGFISLLMGTTAYGLSMVFSVPAHTSNSYRTEFDALMKEPASWTFVRRVGDF